MQDKTPKNEQGEAHGYWETYWSNDQLEYKGLFINGVPFGRHETYRDDGTFNYIINYINGEYYGYYEVHWFDGRITKEYCAK